MTIEQSVVLDIATLGPKGTDSEKAAQLLMEQSNISCKIFLAQSYTAAMDYAKKWGAHFLIPAAYTARDDNGNIIECWADINFRIEEEGILELSHSIILPLKPIGIAVREDSVDVKKMALHAATEYCAKSHFPDVHMEYFCNKPDAVKACSNRETDACIGSLDVIEQFNNLRIKKTFESKMCWTIYKPKSNNF